jgi:colanic acid biosynthesis glycosyl transferase WcaI
VKLLFLTDNYYPETNAPATRTSQHAKFWVEQGHEITIITSCPNFPEGKVHTGHKNFWFKSTIEQGVKVIRVKTFISSNQGTVLRILDYLSFMFSSFLFGLFTKKFDAIVGTSPQFFTVVSAWALSKLKRIPFIFELRDLWPESIISVGALKQSFAISLISKFSLFLYQEAQIIIAVTNSFKEYLLKLGIPESKIQVIYNGSDDCQKHNQEDYGKLDKLDLEEKFVVSYIGTHGLAHGLDKVIEAAELLESYDDIVFLMIGAGANKKKLDETIKLKNIKNIISLQNQPKENLSYYWKNSKIALVCLINKDLFKTVIPSKIFEAASFNVPILASIPKGEATQIIENYKCGVITHPEDPVELANKIVELKHNPKLLNFMSKNCTIMREKFSRRKMATKMIQMIEKSLK